MESSSDVEVTEEVDSFSKIIQEIVETDYCALCEMNPEGEEYVDFCGCRMTTQKIHLSCIKLLETTHNGYLRCTSRDCNKKFNQFIGDKELLYRSILGFEKRYPLTFFCVFLYCVLALVQAGLFVNSTYDPKPSVILPAMIIHFGLLFVYFPTIVLLYEISARDAFCRYFRRTHAETLLQYTISCTILVSILNMLPLFSVRDLYPVSPEFSIWLLVYWICITPSIQWIVMRKNIQNLHQINNLKFYLKAADVQTPSSFRSIQH